MLAYVFNENIGTENSKFTDNHNGTITDNWSGLVWLKSINCFGEKTWDEAVADCQLLGDSMCGLSDDSKQNDWRLPHRKEIQSLFDSANFSPTLPEKHPFSGISDGCFWLNKRDPCNNIVKENYIYIGEGGAGLGGQHACYVRTQTRKHPRFFVWPVRRIKKIYKYDFKDITTDHRVVSEEIE